MESSFFFGIFSASTWVDSLHLRPLVRFGQTKAMVGSLQIFVRGEMIVYDSI